MNYENQQHFNEMMQIAFEEQKERLAGQPDGHEGEPKQLNPSHSTVWNREKQPEKGSSVRNPSHYDIIDTTVNDIIKKLFTHEEYMGWLKGNVLKYRLRAGKKGNQEEDILKADEYQRFYHIYRMENTQ